MDGLIGWKNLKIKPQMILPMLIAKKNTIKNIISLLIIISSTNGLFSQEIYPINGAWYWNSTE